MNLTSTEQELLLKKLLGNQAQILTMVKDLYPEQRVPVLMNFKYVCKYIAEYVKENIFPKSNTVELLEKRIVKAAAMLVVLEEVVDNNTAKMLNQLLEKVEKWYDAV